MTNILTMNEVRKEYLKAFDNTKCYANGINVHSWFACCLLVWFVLIHSISLTQMKSECNHQTNQANRKLNLVYFRHHSFMRLIDRSFNFIASVIRSFFSSIAGCFIQIQFKFDWIFIHSLPSGLNCFIGD